MPAFWPSMWRDLSNGSDPLAMSGFSPCTFLVPAVLYLDGVVRLSFGVCWEASLCCTFVLSCRIAYVVVVDLNAV
jgi:hypothetical protein